MSGRSRSIRSRQTTNAWNTVVLYSGCSAFFFSRNFTRFVASNVSFRYTSHSARCGMRFAITV